MLPFDEALADNVNALFGGTPPLPSIVLVDRKTGAILLQSRGIPSRSDLERAIANLP